MNRYFWILGGFAALVALLAMLDRRYRVKAPAAAPVITPAGSQHA